MQGPFAKNASWQLAACLCTLRLPCHGPSWLLFALPCSFKSEENARTIRQKVLRPPAGTLRGPTCSFTCVLQVKLALGLKNPQFLQQLLEGPKGPPGGPQEASKRPPCSHAPKRPPRGTTCHRSTPQDAPRRPQDAPKTPQDAPRRPQDAPKMAPWGHLGAISAILSHQTFQDAAILHGIGLGGRFGGAAPLRYVALYTPLCMPPLSPPPRRWTSSAGL